MGREFTEDQKKQHKERLKKIISKKFDTVTIFPLSQIEAIFGTMFGWGKNEEDLDAYEYENRLKWYTLRENILNLGNAQKRAAINEIESYDMAFKGYRTDFLLVNKNVDQIDEVNGNLKTEGEI